jgi:hypothetical protein
LGVPYFRTYPSWDYVKLEPYHTLSILSYLTLLFGIRILHAKDI